MVKAGYLSNGESKGMTSPTDAGPGIPNNSRSATRVDILIYCHDGRGLGHVSRSIAIALAIRRISPATRVMLLTGSEYVPALAGFGRIDWLKLPSYKIGGREQAEPEIPNSSSLSHKEIAAIRRQFIAEAITSSRPRVILVDHYPSGKEDELALALNNSIGKCARWYLGIRSIVGTGSSIWTYSSRTLVTRSYSGVLWYGDSTLGCEDIYGSLCKHFKGTSVTEMGYVSRAEELTAIQALPQVEPLGGLAAFTWCSPRSLQILESLSMVMPQLKLALPSWRVTVGASFDEPMRNLLVRRLASESYCEVRWPDFSFLSSLRQARVALLNAGYNSLTDVAWAEIPSVIITRQTTDQEQLSHVERIAPCLGNLVTFLTEEEASDPTNLLNAISGQLEKRNRFAPSLRLGGAGATARLLLSKLSPRPTE